jgi:LPS-assembly lipoprotein
MWSSDRPGRRAFLALALAPLGACGFRPLYAEREGEALMDELAAIEIAGLGGRLGQELRNGLLDELNPTGLPEPSRYVLVVRLSRRESALAIQLDSTVTRFDMILRAAFVLRRKEDGEVLLRDNVRRVASYNVRRAPYATLVAEQDAERRAAREVAREIASRVAVRLDPARPA